MGGIFHDILKINLGCQKIDIGNYFYRFPLRSGMTNRAKQIQAKLESVFFSLSLSGLTRQSRDLG
jgi:hypothetical protein